METTLAGLGTVGPWSLLFVLRHMNVSLLLCRQRRGQTLPTEVVVVLFQTREPYTEKS